MVITDFTIHIAATKNEAYQNAIQTEIDMHKLRGFYHKEYKNQIILFLNQKMIPENSNSDHRSRHSRYQLNSRFIIDTSLTNGQGLSCMDYFAHCYDF